jgi:hypothetical protein
MPRTKETTTKPAVSAETKSSPQGKVYRSVAEIRRSYYPKAGSERARAARVTNDTVGRSTKPRAALNG